MISRITVVLALVGLTLATEARLPKALQPAAAPLMLAPIQLQSREVDRTVTCCCNTMNGLCCAQQTFCNGYPIGCACR